MVFYLFIGILAVLWLALLLVAIYVRWQYSPELQSTDHEILAGDIDLVAHAIDVYCTPNARAVFSFQDEPLCPEIKINGDRIDVSFGLNTPLPESQREELLELAAAHADFILGKADDTKDRVVFHISRDHPELCGLVSTFICSVMQISTSHPAKVELHERRMTHLMFGIFLNHRRKTDNSWMPNKPVLDRHQRLKNLNSNPANHLLFFVITMPPIYIASFVIAGMNAVLITALVISSLQLLVRWNQENENLIVHALLWVLVIVLAMVMGSAALRYLPTIAVFQLAVMMLVDHWKGRRPFIDNLPLSRKSNIALFAAMFAAALGISEWMRLTQPDHVWIVYYAFFRLEIITMWTAAITTSVMLADREKAEDSGA